MTARPGHTVLILEDEAIIGLDLADGLSAAGYAVAGPFADAGTALERLNEARPDAAVLDIDLGGGRTSLPVAERLAELGIPFLFLTGQNVKTTGVLHRFPGNKAIDKPCMPDELLAEVQALFTVAA